MPPHAPRSPRSTRLHTERLEHRLALAGDTIRAASESVIAVMTSDGAVAAIGPALAAPATFSAGTAETTPDRPWIGRAMAAERGAVVFQVRLGAGPDGTTTLQTLPIWARLNPRGDAAPAAADLTAADAITATAFTGGAGGADPIAMPLESLLAAPPPRPAGDGDLFVVIESSSDLLLAITTAGVVLAGAPGRPLETVQPPPADAGAGTGVAEPDNAPAPDGAAGSAPDGGQTVAPAPWFDALLPPASDGLATGSAAAWLQDARTGDSGAFVLWAVPTAAGRPPLLVPLYARFNPAAAEDPALLTDRPRPATARFHSPSADGATIDLDPAADLPGDTAEGFLVIHTDSNLEILLGTILPLFLTLADSPGALPGADADGVALLAGSLLSLPAPPAPDVALLHDTGLHADDRITADGRLAVTELPQTRVEYSADGGRIWQAGHRPGNGDNAVLVRRVDAFGQASEPTAFTFRLDTTAPAAPRPRLAGVPAGVSDPVRRDASLAIGGVEAGARVEFSADGGPWLDSWTPREGSNVVRVRQIDAAGNASTPSHAVRVRIDTVAAPLGVSLARDTGSSPADRITADARLAFSGLEPGATVRYSTDGGATWSARYRPVEGRNRLLVRQLDAAGNLSAPVAFEFTLDTIKPRAPATVRQPATTDALAVPALAAAAGERVEYRVGRGPWREDPPAPRTRITVRVRVVDAAGNVSAVTRLAPPPPERT